MAVVVLGAWNKEPDCGNRGANPPVAAAAAWVAAAEGAAGSTAAVAPNPTKGWLDVGSFKPKSGIGSYYCCSSGREGADALSAAGTGAAAVKLSLVRRIVLDKP